MDGVEGLVCQNGIVDFVFVLASEWRLLKKHLVDKDTKGRLGDIGAAIQKYAESFNYSIVREYCGHGIGSEFHEEPQVMHYGKALVRAQAEEEGIAQIFIDAGFEWRLAGCSMCLAMNPDQLSEGERCASTSNRNFEGRQGYKGRTHLVSPAMAAAAAVTGHLTDVRELMTETETA